MSHFFGILIILFTFWCVFGGITYLDYRQGYKWTEDSYSKGQKYFIRFACGPFCWFGLILSICIDLLTPIWDKFWDWLGTIK